MWYAGSHLDCSPAAIGFETAEWELAALGVRGPSDAYWQTGECGTLSPEGSASLVAPSVRNPTADTSARPRSQLWNRALSLLSEAATSQPRIFRMRVGCVLRHYVSRHPVTGERVEKGSGKRDERECWAWQRPEIPEMLTTQYVVAKRSGAKASRGLGKAAR